MTEVNGTKQFLQKNKKKDKSFSIFGKTHRKTNALQKRLLHRRFPVNYVRFIRTAFLRNTCERLHL